jgi:hypothetical protein
LRQRPGFRVPQTAAEKHLARREVHVEARCVHVLAQRMAEVTGGMLLVRTLVMGKTHVAVNAEHRAAVRPRIGGELFRNPPQLRRHCGDECAHRHLNRVAEAGFVCLEPDAFIVQFQFPKKRKKIFW